MNYEDKVTKLALYITNNIQFRDNYQQARRQAIEMLSRIGINPEEK